LEGLRAELVGQRIARSFADHPDADGDVIHRASIVGLRDMGTSIDDDWFLVMFDDGVVEELQVRRYCSLFSLEI
jgi:hypothetical protein